MRMGFHVLVVSVCLMVLSGAAASVVSGPAAETSPEVPVPSSSGSSQKVHVIETWTGAWCPFCVFADTALSRLQEEYYENSVFLFYHCCAPANDPYFDPLVHDVRENFYGSMVYPVVIFDGGGTYPDPTLVDVGAGTSVGAYDTYRLELEDNVDTSSNMAISINADMTPTAISVAASVTATDPVTQTNLVVHTMIYEDNLYYMGTNGWPMHRNVVRAMNRTAITIAMGQTVTVTPSFPIPPGTWNLNKMGVVAFVQSNTKRTVTGGGYTWTISDIINAAKVDLVPRGILLHMDQGTGANYNEIYEKLLAQSNEHFETWNARVLGIDSGTVDDRQTPDAARLAESPLVIWETGTQTMNTLTPSERTLLENHLNGGGSLVLTGNGIGFEGWTQFRTWYQTYLHAAYESDDTGATYVNGVAGDPISGAYSGTNLNILSSPDRINAWNPGPSVAVPFNYAGPLPAGVRATHDADSRVVYLGFLYFENTIDVNRMAVMTKILDWMDGASPPTVDVVYPDGGEQFNPGANVDIRWHASDIRIPTNGVDIYFNSNYPSGGWTPIAQNQPNDGLYKWTLPSVNSGSCRIRVVARDSSPESADGIGESAGDFICGNPFFEVVFGPADVGTKRLMSFPRLVSDTSVQAVLSSLAGSYGVVRWYDPFDAADHWKAYYPTKGGGDLYYIDNTVGFWIEITAPGTLRIAGNLPSSPTTVGLKQGWNLVGFPSMNAARSGLRSPRRRAPGASESARSPPWPRLRRAAT